MTSLNGSAWFNVSNATSAGRCRKKHMITFDVMSNSRFAACNVSTSPSTTVPNVMPCSVCLWGKENFYVSDVLGMTLPQISACKLLEIIAVSQHRQTGIINVQKVLKTAETVCCPHLFDATVFEGNVVSPAEHHHHLRLQCAFNVHMQLSLWQARNSSSMLMTAKRSAWSVAGGCNIRSYRRTFGKQYD